MHRLHRLSRLAHVTDPVISFAGGITASRRWKRQVRRREPSIAVLLMAGLAVFAFMKVLSASSRQGRSIPEKIALGALLLFLGAIMLSFRRTAVRRGW
jgi:hypothetical protein